MDTQIIMQDPKIYEQIGELTGRFNTFEQNMAREFSELKQTIREQNSVPYPVFEQFAGETKVELKGHDDRIEAIELALKLKEATVTGRIAHFLDSALVKIIGTAVVTGVLLAMYVNYKVQIDNISNKVDNVGKTEQVIEQRK